MARFIKSFLLKCWTMRSFMACLMIVISFPMVSNAITRTDVIDDFMYYDIACPGYANIVWADADGIDNGHPTYGQYETLVVFATLTGEAYPVNEFTPPGKWYFFTPIDAHCGGTEPWDRARLKIHFVDMLEPGFDQTNSTTWVYKRVNAVGIKATNDSVPATENPPFGMGVLAYRNLGQEDIIPDAETCGKYYFTDPVGIKELYIFTDYCENNLDELILDADEIGTEIIIDNDDAGNISAGSWVISTAPNPYGNNSLENIQCGGSLDPIPTYSFKTIISRRFEYDVYLWWTALDTRDSDVIVRISDADQLLANTRVNQQTNGGQWNLLGTYCFACGKASITLVRNCISGSVCADAVRFVAVRPFAGNTPTGSSVVVTSDNVTITFDEVTASGDTTVAQSPSGNAPPACVRTCDPPVYYDISTTAIYNGDIKVCINYDDTICDETNLRLFQYDQAIGTWVDVTDTVDTEANIICGETASLSQFLLATPFACNTPIGPNVVVIIDDVTITFDEVTSTGDTAVTVNDICPILPANFQAACTPPVSYNVTTTAAHEGNIEVGIHYDDTDCDETDLHMLQYEGDQWADVTLPPVDTEANIIRGRTTSLTQFLLATPTDAVLAFDCPIQFNGIDDYFSTPFVLNPAEGPFSVVVWIQGGAPGQVIISQKGTSNWLLENPSNGTLMSELGGHLLKSEAMITDGVWHNVHLVWDGFSRTLYVDGLMFAMDMINVMQSSNAGLYIGAGKDLKPGSFWSGIIGDIRIYDRVVNP